MDQGHQISRNDLLLVCQFLSVNIKLCMHLLGNTCRCKKSCSMSFILVLSQRPIKRPLSNPKYYLYLQKKQFHWILKYVKQVMIKSYLHKQSENLWITNHWHVNLSSLNEWCFQFEGLSLMHFASFIFL